MQQAIILVGNSGAGKSTWAEKFVRENQNFVRVNKDSIRKCLVYTNSASGYWARDDNYILEIIVKNTMEQMISLCHFHGKDIVVDGTNITQANLDYLLSILEGRFDYTFRVFTISVEEARERVMKREGLDCLDETRYLERYDVDFQNMLAYLVVNNYDKLTYNKI